VDIIHQRDRQTDGRTDTGQQQRPRSRITSRGKNALAEFGTHRCRPKPLQLCVNDESVRWYRLVGVNGTLSSLKYEGYIVPCADESTTTQLIGKTARVDTLKLSLQQVAAIE